MATCKKTIGEWREFACLKCGDLFRARPSKANLNALILKRTAACGKLYQHIYKNPRTFKCQYCTSTFVRRFNLQRHIKSHCLGVKFAAACAQEKRVDTKPPSPMPRSCSPANNAPPQV